MSLCSSRSLYLFLLLLGSFAGNPRTTSAETHITSFSAEVILQKNGTAIITETIAVQFDANPPQVGISRSLPKKILGADKRARPISAQINYVFRDGSKEEFAVEAQAEADLVRTGSTAVLSPGIHTFTLQYEKASLIRSGTDYDGFSIALPGKWSWPVDSTLVVIKFPEFLEPKSAVIMASVSSYSDPSFNGGKVLPLVDESRVTINYPTRLLPNQTLWIEFKLPKNFIQSTP